MWTTGRRAAGTALGALAFATAVVLPHALVPGLTAASGSAPAHSGISLIPAVVELKGQHGQSHRQALRLTNHTSRELSFEMVAEDVIVDGDRRLFIRAGDRGDSIAATAVFSPRTVVIPPGEVGVAEMVLTVPPRTAVRAVAAIFRGRTVVGSESGVAMTASLGTLITFSLAGSSELEAAQPEVQPQTATDSLTIEEWVVNVGTEPVVAGGTAGILDRDGTLVARLPIERQRLLPGERLRFSSKYPALLPPGQYRALVSLEHDDIIVNRSVDFVVAPHGGDPRRAAAGAHDVHP
jgi:hypothetical protein